MATTEITDENFRDIYQKNDIVVLDFWAVWCGPCHQFSPIYESLSTEFPDMVFGKIDTESQAKLSEYFAVRSIPTIVVIREQLEVFRNPGSMDSNTLRSVLKQIQEADMNEVRQKIEQEESASEQ